MSIINEAQNIVKRSPGPLVPSFHIHFLRVYIRRPHVLFIEKKTAKNKKQNEKKPQRLYKKIYLKKLFNYNSK